MLDEAAAAYRENRKINRRKAKALRIAIAGAAAQTLLVAAALVAGVLALAALLVVVGLRRRRWERRGASLGTGERADHGSVSG
jgi:hypothetical protein